ncbi:MAG: TonB-dependent receptor plug domain-containing protein, partial [Bacteroidaceae bacterium]
MKQTAILFAMATMLTVSAHAKQNTNDNTNDNVTDSTHIVDIEEIEIISTPKETGKLKQLPGSVTLLGQTEMKRHTVTSLKETGNVVANLFIPDYGSHLTSAIYIRGIGSRINTPAVGLYVDNVP